MRLHILKGVGSTADDESVAQYFAGFSDRHIVLAQMHTVYLQFLHESHTVVDEEGGLLFSAPFLHLQGDRAHFVVGSSLHAQLDPFASAS